MDKARVNAGDMSGSGSAVLSKSGNPAAGSGVLRFRYGGGAPGWRMGFGSSNERGGLSIGGTPLDEEVIEDTVGREVAAEDVNEKDELESDGGDGSIVAKVEEDDAGLLDGVVKEKTKRKSKKGPAKKAKDEGEDGPPSARKRKRMSSMIILAYR
jgi:hypothetical protein